MIDAYEELFSTLSNLLDSTKDIDLVLSEPVSIKTLSSILVGISGRLRSKSWRVVGERIRLGQSLEDWVAQIFISVKPGYIVNVEILNFLVVRPLILCEIRKQLFQCIELKIVDLKSLAVGSFAGSDKSNTHNQGTRKQKNTSNEERVLLALAIYTADSKPEDVLKDMVSLTSSTGVAKRLASSAWEIVYGEEYTL